MFGDFLYNLIIGPLEMLFDIIYVYAYKLTADPGAAIICLSLMMNLLLLPLYNRTDAIQAEANATEKAMAPGVKHIKKTFRGNEQYMMLQTYYRQNGYKPTDVLKGIAPLALEIPFFMAAYHYLSHLSVLEGCSYGWIQDLSKPDGILVMGSLRMNLLPIAMTVINILSSLIYTRNAPLKTKIQLYGMAGLFLILLYDSPAALAFYWTLNNLFSLVKNLLVKLPHPRRTVSWLAAGCSLIPLGALISKSAPDTARGVLIVIALALNLPLAWYFLEKKKTPASGEKPRPQWAGFATASLILTVLIGLLIPSALLHSSPEEFMPLAGEKGILTYVGYCVTVAAGAFLLWMGLLYGLVKPGGKKAMEIAAWLLCGICIADYMFFGRHYGVLSNRLVFETELQISSLDKAMNAGVLILVCALIGMLLWKKPSVLRITGAAAAAAMVVLSAVNMVQTQKIVSDTQKRMEEATRPESLFQLSQTGKNVVILMMDRAVGGFVPYIFNEKPELQQQFDGFTYYPNTLSYGAHTNFGLPAVFGGYEYTPLALNRRDQEPLKNKHNEALLMMPMLFTIQDFQATVCDPTYANYEWYPDLSVFDPYPEIPAYITRGAYVDRMAVGDFLDQTAMKHKFLFYSFFKCSPVAMHSYMYDRGAYQLLPIRQDQEGTSTPVTSTEVESGEFRDAVSVLQNLQHLSEITEENKNTFMMMCNDTAHSPQMLQMPDYVLKEVVDNRPYEQLIPTRTDGAGNSITLTTVFQMKHYHVNMASYLELAKWLDYLKENDVYDNTRIVIVSDHGQSVRVRPELIFGDAFEDDILFYNPVLMVKDFNARGPLRTDETRMTNADVPTIVTEGLIENPVNPFTGNPITNVHQKDDPFYICLSHIYSTKKNNGNTFLPDPWAAVSGDMWDKNNWKLIDPSQLPAG